MSVITLVVQLYRHVDIICISHMSGNVQYVETHGILHKVIA